jgi:hypothetical protein
MDRITIFPVGKGTYCCPGPLLKPNESKREKTHVFSQTPSLSTWNGSTGRSSYAPINTRYARSYSTCGNPLHTPGYCSHTSGRDYQLRLNGSC